jgi:hypothetical protein
MNYDSDYNLNKLPHHTIFNTNNKHIIIDELRNRHIVYDNIQDIFHIFDIDNTMTYSQFKSPFFAIISKHTIQNMYLHNIKLSNAIKIIFELNSFISSSYTKYNVYKLPIEICDTVHMVKHCDHIIGKIANAIIKHNLVDRILSMNYVNRNINIDYIIKNVLCHVTDEHTDIYKHTKIINDILGKINKIYQLNQPYNNGISNNQLDIIFSNIFQHIAKKKYDHDTLKKIKIIAILNNIKHKYLRIYTTTLSNQYWRFDNNYIKCDEIHFASNPTAIDFNNIQITLVNELISTYYNGDLPCLIPVGDFEKIQLRMWALLEPFILSFNRFADANMTVSNDFVKRNHIKIVYKIHQSQTGGGLIFRQDDNIACVVSDLYLKSSGKTKIRLGNTCAVKEFTGTYTPKYEYLKKVSSAYTKYRNNYNNDCINEYNIMKYIYALRLNITIRPYYNHCLFNIPYYVMAISSGTLTNILKYEGMLNKTKYVNKCIDLTIYKYLLMSKYCLHNDMKSDNVVVLLGNLNNKLTLMLFIIDFDVSVLIK